MRMNRYLQLLCCILSLLLFTMCIPEMALSSSSGPQGEKKIYLDLYFVINGPLKEDDNRLKELLNPFHLSFQNEELFKRSSKGILFVPTETAEIIRLDCPPDKSTYTIRDWRSFWWTISEWTGDVSRSRIKEDWGKAVNNIKIKDINDLCPENERKEADFARLKNILSGKQVFYLLTEESDAKEGWYRGGQEPRVRLTPKDMWADLCQMCKEKQLEKVAIVVAYDQSTRGPRKQDQNSIKQEVKPFPGPKPGPSKIRELLEKGEFAEAKRVLESMKNGSGPEVDHVRQEMDTRLDLMVKFQYQRPHSGPSGKMDLTSPRLANLTLTPKDNYRMFIETLSPAYLYVFQVDAEGRVDRLFPNPFYNKTDNPVLPLLSLQIPFAHSEWLYLEEIPREAPPRRNTLYFLASPWPAKHLDELYGKLHQEANPAARNEVLRKFMDALEAWKTSGIAACFSQELTFAQSARLLPAQSGGN